MDMHPAHKHWATHMNFVEGEQFFELLKTVDPAIQKVFIDTAGAGVGARNEATLVQFKKLCADLTEVGMADFMLVHAMVGWVLAYMFGISNTDDIDEKTTWLRDAAKWFKSEMVRADEEKKKTLELAHAQAHEATQEMTSRTLRNERMYLQICEELVIPLLAMPPAFRA